MSTYFDDIKDGIRSTIKGLSLTFGHIRNATKRRQPLGIASDNYFEQQNGLVTVQYPHETIPIPDNGRYRLHNEIDDCIVCDKCAKVCPVDCITIEAIKATEEIGRASDGSPIRLYAGKFDIDMAKCCYCGLCTVVCPTECLTMEKKFDYSEFELGKLTYEFSNLTPDEAAQKRSLYEQFVLEKEQEKQRLKEQAAAKAASTAENKERESEIAKERVAPKPAFRPTAKPTENKERESERAKERVTPKPTEPALNTELSNTKPTEPAKPKPAFRPTLKPKPAEPTPNAELSNTEPIEPAKPKPAFRPTLKPKPAEPTPNAELSNTEPTEPAKPKPAFRPTLKPKPATAVVKDAEETIPVAGIQSPESPALLTTDKGVSTSGEDHPAAQADNTVQPTEDKERESERAKERTAPKPAFRPTMKPKAAVESTSNAEPISGGTNLSRATTPDAPKATEPTQSAVPQNTATSQNPEQPEPPKPKPAFRPTMKTKAAAEPTQNSEQPETAKPKPDTNA